MFSNNKKIVTKHRCLFRVEMITFMSLYLLNLSLPKHHNTVVATE